MQALEFELLSSRDDLIEPSVLDRMVPPTLDEWTVAIETLKHRDDVRQVSFDDYRKQRQYDAMKEQGFVGLANAYSVQQSQGLVQQQQNYAQANLNAANQQNVMNAQGLLGWRQSHPQDSDYIENMLRAMSGKQ